MKHFHPNNLQVGSEDKLEDVARREARRRTPEFSQALHDRLMHAVQTAAPAGSDSVHLVPRPRDMGSVRTGRAVAAVLVAVVALAVNGRMKFTDGKPSVSSKSVNVLLAQNAADSDALPTIAVIETVPAQVQSAVESTVTLEQFAGLDQDARRATRYLIDQVPFQDAWNNP